MLVLRRKVGESIILDGVISVSVLAVEGERVKIGITAPPASIGHDFWNDSWLKPIWPLAPVTLLARRFGW
jgi:hypothetical protein